MTAPELIVRNRALQAELYGEPLQDLLGRIGSRLHLTQARIAEAVGLSPAMLSQLIRAQRVKIGNPAVMQRLQALDSLAGEAEQRRVDQDQLEALLIQIRGTTGALTRTTTLTSRTADSRAVVHGIQDVLRAAASAGELAEAANLLERRHPRLATVLRVYGNGRTDDAIRHYEAATRPD